MYNGYQSRSFPLDYRQARDSAKILHFSLQDTLPSGHSLALNLACGSLLLLDSTPCLLQQEQFTHTEMSVLLPLLVLFPYYCPNEVLYASFYSDGKVNEESTAQARNYLTKASAEGLWEQEMRPVRSALSRTRIKVRSFGIDISSILATGYILIVARKLSVAV